MLRQFANALRVARYPTSMAITCEARSDMLGTSTTGATNTSASAISGAAIRQLWVCMTLPSTDGTVSAAVRRLWQ
ncbi:hypothetical protein FQZ97_998420 [compost metagenome]